MLLYQYGKKYSSNVHLCLRYRFPDDIIFSIGYNKFCQFADFILKTRILWLHLLI